MQQKENEESEKHYAHNNKGTNPAGFEDVEENELRHANRGAIMANIFERYTTSTPQGNSQLLSKDFASMSRELNAYVLNIPKKERGKAKKCMIDHLEKRGYRES